MSALPGEVISLAARPGYRPDLSAIACSQVAAARADAGLSLAEFAARLGPLLGWEPTAEAVKRWEEGTTPPGDVLLACSSAGHEIPELEVPLLAVVPPAFPAAALDGYWVTAYQFRHGGQLRYHVDIANVTAAPGGRIQAVNHPPQPRTEGRPLPFHNEINAGLAGRHLVGEWRNTSDTRYYGSLHLAVLPGETVMEGWYSGVGSDVEVSSGSWKGVRLDPTTIPDDGLGKVLLGEPAAVHDAVMSHSQYGAPLGLAVVRGEH
jgi:hypothetical protein